MSDPVARPYRVLVIDGDDMVRQAIALTLSAAGYEVTTASNGAAALALIGPAGRRQPDLVVLDLVLPDADGLLFCADLKARLGVPIIVCSGTSRKRDPILALKLGADDFIAKPFDAEELGARVEAVLRRARPVSGRVPAQPARETAAPPGPRRIGALSLDRSGRAAVLGSEALHLTPAEFALLDVLMSHPAEVLSREDLARLVWGYAHVPGSRLVDVYVSRLRAKLTTGGPPPASIVAVHGRGYMLVNLDGGAAPTAP